MNKFTFTKENLSKISKWAAIAAGWALLTYLATFISETDFGIYTPVIVAAWSILINAGREFLKK